MGKEIKVKADNVEFDAKLKDINLEDRKQLRILFHKLNNEDYIKDNGYFPVSIEIIQKATDMTDDQINQLSDGEIYALATSIIGSQNKKNRKNTFTA